MENIVVCLGSNYGDRQKNVAEALEWVSGKLTDALNSGIYETPAFGHSGGPYLNAVVEGMYPASLLADLEKECKQYERSHGRDDEARHNKRVPIDIDIVKAGTRILRPADYTCEFFRKGYLLITGGGL